VTENVKPLKLSDFTIHQIRRSVMEIADTATLGTAYVVVEIRDTIKSSLILAGVQLLDGTSPCEAHRQKKLRFRDAP